MENRVGKPVKILHIDRRNKDSSFILEWGFRGIIIVKMILFCLFSCTPFPSPLREHRCN